MNHASASGVAPAPVLKRILVATDFSQAGRRAVWRAGQLARMHDASLHLVHARPDWNLFCRSSAAANEHYRGISEHAEEALKAELEYLQATFNLHVRGETRMGRASEVLTSAIAENDPNLVVVGARGEHDTPPAAPFLGGTALKLIAQTDRPVLMVRKEGKGAYTVTLAAVDDSQETARRLVAWATSLLGHGDCHIEHAFDAPYVERMRALGITEAIIDACTLEARKAAQRSVDAVLSGGAGEGQRLHAHLVCGETIASVLAEIARCRPELVVVGKHQNTPLESATRFVGTNALRIAYHAASDVLIVA